MAASLATVPGKTVDFTDDQVAELAVLFRGPLSGLGDPGDVQVEARDWVLTSIEAARGLDGAGGAYLTFSAAEETNERVLHQRYGGNFDRLRTIKRQYDPDSLFRISNTITPTEVVAVDLVEES